MFGGGRLCHCAAACCCGLLAPPGEAIVNPSAEQAALGRELLRDRDLFGDLWRRLDRHRCRVSVWACLRRVHMTKRVDSEVRQRVGMLLLELAGDAAPSAARIAVAEF